MTFSSSITHTFAPLQVSKSRCRRIAMNFATVQPRQQSTCCYGIPVPRSKAISATCSAVTPIQNHKRPLYSRSKHEGPCSPAHRQRGCIAGHAYTRRQTVAPCRAVETQRGGVSGFAEEVYRYAKTPLEGLLIIFIRIDVLERKPGVDIFAVTLAL